MLPLIVLILWYSWALFWNVKSQYEFPFSWMKLWCHVENRYHYLHCVELKKLGAFSGSSWYHSSSLVNFSIFLCSKGASQQDSRSQKCITDVKVCMSNLHLFMCFICGFPQWSNTTTALVLVGQLKRRKHYMYFQWIPDQHRAPNNVSNNLWMRTHQMGLNNVIHFISFSIWRCHVRKHRCMETHMMDIHRDLACQIWWQHWYPILSR